MGSVHQLNRMIENDNIDKEKLSIYNARLNRTVVRIEKIVKGLRSITRESSLDPFKKIKAEDIVDDVLAICKERLSSNGISFKMTGDLDTVLECRSNQISQVLLNLINNSYEAILNDSSAWIQVHVKCFKDSVHFEVTDSGLGIPHAIAEKMMVPLFTTKVLSKATGLGLSISHALIQEHSGKFWYDQSCKHTRFVIELPLEQVQKSSIKQAA